MINYGMDLNYQQTDSNNGSTSTSSAQEKFTFYFLVHSKPASRLSVDGILRFDVLQNSIEPGSESTEVQPNTELKLATSAMQLGMGYRRILRNENIVTAASTNALTSDSSDAYADATLRAGKLPTLRVRYSLRDQRQEKDGAVTFDTSTNDLQAALNYRLGIFSMNADYRAQNSKDNLTGITTDETQFLGQLALARKLGTKMDVGLRENYNFNQSVRDNETTRKQYTSISEGRFVYNPFRGVNINTNYIYRIFDDMLNPAGAATEKTWFSAVNYVLPKYLRLYGSYLLLDSDNEATESRNTTAIAGVNFANTFGKFSVSSRYEKRWDTSSSTTLGTAQIDNGVTLFRNNCQSCHGPISSTAVRGRTDADIQAAIADMGPPVNGVMGFLGTLLTPEQIQTIAAALNSPRTAAGFQATTEKQTSRDNFDWVVSARLARYLNLALSESYVASTTDAGTSTDNRFRLKVDLGPLKNLMMTPYIDYDVNTPAAGQEITTTQLVFPVNYRLSLHRKLELNMLDTYQWTTTESMAGTSSSQTNNATLRLTLASPLPGTMFSGDATFTTSSTNAGQTTSTSAYSVKGTWAKGPHSLNANFRYQTGSNIADNAGMAFLYGLNLRMKKLIFAFQARYDYSIVFPMSNAGGETSQSTAQTVYLMMSLKK